MTQPAKTAFAASLAAPHRLLGLFRAVALFEGLTTVLLFGVAMPIKYGLGDVSWVKVMGPLHGYAFLAYMGLMIPALRGPRFGERDRWRTALAALIPFGTFINDPHLRRCAEAPCPEADL